MGMRAQGFEESFRSLLEAADRHCELPEHETLRRGLDQLMEVIRETEAQPPCGPTTDEFFRLLASSAPVGIFLTDSADRITHANQRWLDISGLSIEQTLRGGWTSAVHPDDRGEASVIWEKVQQERKDFCYETRIALPSGEQRWVRVRASPMFTPGGEATGYLGTVEDITERRRAEDVLRQSEKKYRDLADSIADIFFAFDRNLRCTYWNRASERILGAQAERAIGSHVSELLPPEQAGEIEAIFRGVLETGQAHVCTSECQLAGQSRMLELSVYPSATGLSVFVRDQTARVAAQQALAASEEKFRGIYEASPIGIALLDAQGLPLEANGAMLEVLGMSSMKQMRSVRLLDVPQIPPSARSDLAEGRTVHFSFDLDFDADGHDALKTKGSRRAGQAYLDMWITPLSGPISFLVKVQDVTDRLCTEQALRGRTRQLSALARVSRRINAVMDVDAILVRLAQAAVELLESRAASAGQLVDGSIELRYFVRRRRVREINMSFDAGVCVPGWVMKHRRPYIANDAEHDPVVNQELRRALNVESLICVPILRGGRLLGCIEGYDRPDRPFGKEDVEMLQGLAATGAIAIDNAHAMADRVRAENALTAARDELERRVGERTAELERTVRRLRAEIAGREAAEAERQRLETEVLRVGENERRKIGQDLHDILGQNLTGAAFLGRVLRQRLAAMELPEADDAAEIEKAVNEAMGVAKTIARGLSPVDIEAGGLAQALARLACEGQTVRNVRTRFHCDQPNLVREVVRDVMTANQLYRIAVEALNNAYKYAKANNIEMRLAQTDDGIELNVEDDGVGLPDEAARGQGMGLRIMSHRARAIGGRLEIARRAEGGTRITCTLPRRDGAGE